MNGAWSDGDRDHYISDRYWNSIQHCGAERRVLKGIDCGLGHEIDSIYYFNIRYCCVMSEGRAQPDLALLAHALPGFLRDSSPKAPDPGYIGVTGSVLNARPVRLSHNS